jgi:hypothetical protein
VRAARLVPASLAVLLAAAPAVGTALEPRYDHRDSHGPFVEALRAHDTVARPGAPTASSWRNAVRAGWGFDVSGEGDELIFGGMLALGSPDDPAQMRVLAALDARYRGYFGTEQLKTFFDVGAWVPIRDRLAVGPLVGLGLAWDFSRASGVYAAAGFATAFGEARIASLSLSVGAQLRFGL